MFSDALISASNSKENKITMMDFILGNKDPGVGITLSSQPPKS